ncbi:ribose transport system substrate-binding protein [Bacillus mesophilus]|uniref:Sugar ABC transporter substrate-binding protein n=1 Tax=Bacillus mesophilus TaxID=1808955 RepID=A0A6M0Q7U8_9BACI|nr:substrate-binding domain-containing protein [Bacillus mesophilus]MBM7661777.1 ribose transport system substrate-binding protein [Bacillus mesophilus]NEY72435.1 sugar ABC transporter substrate-binding protein [Bacillus mesophilus]
MRSVATIVIVLICFVLSYFTVESVLNAFRSDWQVPEPSKQEQITNRIVLITRGLDTPFWDKVSKGAKRQAEKDGARLEVWGSYGENQDFLKQIDIAIYSKVDGIIVQGLDNDEFKELTKVKAASYGIPVITVANDVPMSESIRRTYVGSDQYEAGSMIAKQLIEDMGTSGEVILLIDKRQEHYQTERLKGIQDILSVFPDIEMIEVLSENTREAVISTTKDILNINPSADAFITVNASFAGDMIEEIERRSNVEPYHIYSFDDHPVSLSLLKQGKIDGMIQQSPEKMGEISVGLMMNWLNEEIFPLQLEGYLTDIQIIKQVDTYYE